MFLIAALLLALFSSGSVASALEMPPLKAGINDFAAMLPPASLDDLGARVRRFNTETANGIVVLTLKTLDGEDIQSVALGAFNKLPLSDATLRGLAKIAKLTDQRRKQLDRRLRENTFDEFAEALRAIRRSKFCHGENERGWKADFDFLLQPKSFTRLLEGFYDGALN